MTDKEKAIVMAHTGICMLTGDKFQIFHKYVEDIMGRPIWTHEMGIESIADEIKAKSKDDFIALCAAESSSENPNEWIPVSERLPKELDHCLCCDEDGYMTIGYVLKRSKEWNFVDDDIDIDVVAWMPLPEPYKPDCEPRESDHKCHTCRHYTSGDYDGSCGSYICKEYSNWESEVENDT